jgi:hypothetical protein
MGSPANLIEQQQRGISSDLISKASNLGSNNPFKGPTARSLFYEAAKRNPGKYGQFLFYSLGSNENDFIDSYYRSENSQYNRRVSSLKSKNPSAGYLIAQTNSLESISNSNDSTLSGLSSSFERDIVGGLSAPYSWKDFLYSKHYGTIPNNYMITLRRFPTPVLDNFSLPASIKDSDSYRKEGAGRPVAQAVTWFGGNTGNSLNELIAFTTGLEWKNKTQEEIVASDAFSKGFFGDLPFQWFSSAARTATGSDAVTQGISSLAEGAAVAFDPNNTTIDDLRVRGLRDRAKDGTAGLLSEYIWVPMDVVKNTQVRNTGLKFTWESLVVNFEYELTSVGEVNTKAAMLDILGNMLSIGTNYGNFLTPDIRYNSAFPAIGFPGGDAGLASFYRDPLQFILEYGDKLTNPTKIATEAAGASETGGYGLDGSSNGGVNDLRTEFENIVKDSKTSGGLSIDKFKSFASKFGEGAGKILKLSVLPEFIDKWQAPASILTGAPIGEWHLTIGNPCNPIAMIGNLICDEVDISFGDVLGPDDFPTTLKAKFTLKHGRDRERGEIESIFNRGDGRLYQSSLDTSASAQSYNSQADVNGKPMTEQTINEYLNMSSYDNSLPDQLGPSNP